MLTASDVREKPQLSELPNTGTLFREFAQFVKERLVALCRRRKPSVAAKDETMSEYPICYIV